MKSISTLQKWGQEEYKHQLGEGNTKKCLYIITQQFTLNLKYSNFFILFS